MGPPKDPSDNTAFPEHLVSGLQNTAALIQSLLGEMRDNAIALSALSADMKNLREIVSSLSKILKDGNGHPSLVTRMTMVEKEVSDSLGLITKNGEAIGKLEECIRNAKTESLMSAKEMKGEKLRFWASVIPGCLALVGSILAIVLK